MYLSHPESALHLLGMATLHILVGGRLNRDMSKWYNISGNRQIIAEEAGALWIDVEGDPIDYSDPIHRVEQNFTFCVAPPVLHAQLIRIIDGRLEK